MASLIRILFLAAAVFGAYKIYPHVQPQIKEALGDPRVLGEAVYSPVAKSINQVLPDNIKLPSIKPGNLTPTIPSSPSAVISSPGAINTIIESVKQKAGEVANQQIDNLKVEAGKAFCQVLLEKIKSECGQNN